MRWWAFWRRTIYGAGFLTLLSLMVVGVYYLFLYTPSSCFDVTQNGIERGVDCGGGCARICTADVDAPFIKWVRSFRVTDGMYNAVAYIENRNVNAGVADLRYTIRLFDRDGLITEREGRTPLPPNTVYPLFEGRINTGTRVPTQTVIEFEGEQVWVNAISGGERFRIERRELTSADQDPVLTATLRNDSLDEARDVDVVATIFDQEGTALTASRTKIPSFPGRSTRDVTFTWQEPIAKTVRSCEVPTDVVLAIDLSGSMNDDGGTPPEPVTSVLVAARAFVERLNPKDQVGVVTYATAADTPVLLTVDHARVAAAITALTIDPRSERGSTNTGDALIKAREEIISVRHSDAARSVVILLTDGLATSPKDDPEGYARAAANELKDAGIELFTIGLGASLNETFLREIATDERHYYKAPGIGALGQIYESITAAMCEQGAAVIEIIPKQSATFAPLQ